MMCVCACERATPDCQTSNEGLQNAVGELHSFCVEWKLDVNAVKINISYVYLSYESV